jgi:hypothetical protein
MLLENSLSLTHGIALLMTRELYPSWPFFCKQQTNWNPLPAIVQIFQDGQLRLLWEVTLRAILGKNLLQVGSPERMGGPGVPSQSL